jgi:hypothetical protein
MGRGFNGLKRTYAGLFKVFLKNPRKSVESAFVRVPFLPFLRNFNLQKTTLADLQQDFVCQFDFRADV